MRAQTREEKVAQFMEACGQPTNQGFDLSGLELGMNLIMEEWQELHNEYVDVVSLSSTGELPDVKKAQFLKELADLAYVVSWTAAKIGLPLDVAFNRVHNSNLSKLGPDGEPIRREDGKILKGANYQPPKIIDLVRG